MHYSRVPISRATHPTTPNSSGEIRTLVIPMGFEPTTVTAVNLRRRSAPFLELRAPGLTDCFLRKSWNGGIRTHIDDWVTTSCLAKSATFQYFHFQEGWDSPPQLLWAMFLVPTCRLQRMADPFTRRVGESPIAPHTLTKCCHTFFLKKPIVPIRAKWHDK